MKKIENPKQFAYDLSEWYRHNKRDLPFRHTRDPYKIFLSELMLQQTQITTMIPYYQRFIDRFPDTRALAKADEREVLKYWEGLGYYRRARYIRETATIIEKKYGGTFPENLEAIESLKGVGRYTARAIHSIAFNQPSPAVDGNVLRVMSRIMVYDEDIRKTRTMRTVESALERVIIHESPSDFTQGLMELGALVCKPRPLCGQCPIRSHCFACKQNTQDLYPYKSKPPAKTREDYVVLVVHDGSGQLLLRQRPADGLLGGMYELFQVRTDHPKQALEALKENHMISIAETTFLGTFKHIFTHKTWHMQVYLVTVSQTMTALVHPGDFPYAITGAHHKIIDYLKENTHPFKNH